MNIRLSRGLRRAALASVAALLPVVPATTAVAAPSVSASPSVAAASHPSWPKTLTFGEVGAENSTALDTQWGPIIKLVKAKLGVSLNVVTGTSYASMIEAQQSGKAQIVGYGPFSYYIAKSEGLKISLLAIPINAPHTDGGYYSEGVINPTTTHNITSLKQAKGAKVCFSDPASTSGYLFPSYGLLQAGINPQKDVKGTFTGTDTSTALAVSKGQCTLGFTNTDSLPEAEQTHAIDASKVKVIWKSQEIPASPLAISDSVPASLRSALEKTLVKDGNSPWLAKHGYCPSVAKCTSTSEGWGYAPPSVAHYGLIAKVCKLTKSPACKA